MTCYNPGLMDYLERLARAWEFVEKGGVLTWPLLLFSIVSAAVIIERLWTFRKASINRDGWFSAVMELVEKADWKGALAAASVDSPSARVISPLIEKVLSGGKITRTGLEKLANHYGGREVNKLERFLPTLSTIGNVAPLLGLMGTVLGMVKAFMKIEALQGKVNAAVLAGGIWEALLTTLYGLAVAIPTVIAHNYLAARVARTAAEIQDQALLFVDAAEETLEGDGKEAQ